MADGGSSWIKRIQWSRSGYKEEDERVNTLTSLWVEGQLGAFELVGEVYAALREHLPAAGSGSGELRDYVKGAQLSAQWLELVAVVDFCHRHPDWDTPEKRRVVLERMDQAVGADADRGPLWIQRVRETPSQFAELDQRFAVASRQWVDGAEHRSYFDELVAIQTEAENRKTEVLADPAANQFSAWSGALQTGIKGMVLRTVADYCQAHDWTDPADRQRALDEISQALAGRSAPDQGPSR